MARMRIKNVAAGFYDASGFHPIRRSPDYDPTQLEEGDYQSRKDRRGLRYKMVKRGGKRVKVHLRKNPRLPRLRRGLDYRWWPLGLAAGKRGTYPNMYAARAAVRSRLTAADDPRTARENFYWGYMDGEDERANRATRKTKANPIPLGHFAPAKVRRTRSGDIEVLLLRRSIKRRKASPRRHR
jgi:hypothetical protein